MGVGMDSDGDSDIDIAIIIGIREVRDAIVSYSPTPPLSRTHLLSKGDRPLHISLVSHEQNSPERRR
jgi:hypothetical protein